MRQELLALRGQNADPNAQVAALGQRVAALEAVQETERQSAAGNRALTIRSARLLPSTFTILAPAYRSEPDEPDVSTGRYDKATVYGAVEGIRDRLLPGDLVVLLLHLVMLPASLVQMDWDWSHSRKRLICKEGYGAEEVDLLFDDFRAMIEQALDAVVVAS